MFNFEAFWLLLELIGLRPRIDHDPELAETLRQYGWRPFYFYRVTQGD